MKTLKKRDFLKEEIAFREKINLRKVIIVTGPTASGKTNLSIEIAKKINGEIINCDVIQLYNFCKIGSAQPSDKEKEEVPHHLFSLYSENDFISSSHLKEMILDKINYIESLGKIPIITGGAFFYIYSLFFEYIDETEEKEKNILLDFFYNKKNYKFDSEEKRKLLSLYDKNFFCNEKDVYRTERAFDLLYSGILPSFRKIRYSPKREYLIFQYDWEKENLHNRIEGRVNEMIFNGWLKEFEGLSPEQKDWIFKKKVIGYDHIKNFSEKIISKEDCVKYIFRDTKKYSKKQICFSKKLDKDIKENLHNGIINLKPSLSKEDIYGIIELNYK